MAYLNNKDQAWKRPRTRSYRIGYDGHAPFALGKPANLGGKLYGARCGMSFVWKSRVRRRKDWYEMCLLVDMGQE